MVNRIGHYELTADLGSGAMGNVYLARDARLDREVCALTARTRAERLS